MKNFTPLRFILTSSFCFFLLLISCKEKDEFGPDGGGKNPDLNGYAPKTISAEGHLIYIQNLNPIGQPNNESVISRDEGVTFQIFQHEVDRVISYLGTYQSYHQMPSGRHVAFTYQHLNFITVSCTGFLDGCNQNEVVLTDEVDGFLTVFYNAENEAILGGYAVSRLTGL